MIRIFLCTRFPSREVGEIKATGVVDFEPSVGSAAVRLNGGRLNF